MIDIEDVSFKYGSEERECLKSIDLHISKGECVLLCGRSGCGKTTVTKLVNGLIPHFDEGELRGKVTVAGMDVAGTEMYRLSQKVGSVFQNPKTQFFNIDSDSEIAFGLENQGMEPGRIRERIDETVRQLRVEGILGRNLFEMSGGERQLLAFASVHAIDPDVYVLDEPSANLDRDAIDQLRECLMTIKRQGKTVLIAEHRLYYLMDIIDKAAYMDCGEVRRVFSRDELLALPMGERKEMGLRTRTAPRTREDVVGDDPGTPCRPDLEVQGLCCKFKKRTVLGDVSLSASGGDVIGVLGENGAGKTTLMRCLAGLLKERGGRICIGGERMKPRQRTEQHYMIMQDVGHQLFAESVWDECLLSDDEAPEEAVENVLKEASLLEFRDSHPMTLSGGQKQRLAIATGVLSDKKVLIFDEPTSGLDYFNMLRVSDIIKRLAGEGRIVFVVTHDMEFLEATCSRGIIMDNGAIVKQSLLAIPHGPCGSPAVPRDACAAPFPGRNEPAQAGPVRE